MKVGSNVLTRPNGSLDTTRMSAIVGQILTTRNNFRGKKEYRNQLSCMETLLGGGVVPIVNENDTVSIQELMFTDNDELYGLVAKMMGAGRRGHEDTIR